MLLSTPNSIAGVRDVAPGAIGRRGPAAGSAARWSADGWTASAGGPAARTAGGAAGRPGGPGPLMEALDTDHDGVLSAEEIRRAPESLRALDRDRDGRIEGSELRARPGGRAGRNRPGSGAAGGPGDLGPPPGGPEGFGPPPGGPGGRGRGPEVGDVMPPFVRQQIRLDADQSRKIKALESDVRAKLNRILSRDQMRDFDRILRQGPGGLRRGGPPGGPGGPVDDDGPPVRPGRPDEP